MKILELELKKKVLIVDLHDIDIKYKPKIIQDSFGFWIYFKITGNKPAKIEIPHTCFDYKNYKDYKFICKGSELTEEMASELCHNIGNCLTIEGNAYLNDEHEEVYFEFAQEAIISAVESKGFHWLENPIEKPKYYDKILTRNCLIWQEAEEKTFKNPLIFVKK